MTDNPTDSVVTDAMLAERFWARVDKRGPDECWPWTGSRRQSGYGQLHLDGRMRQATHVSVFLTTGDWPAAGMVACHRCDNPPCVNPAHLFVATRAENNADRDAKGRGIAGERQHISKLTREAVIDIRTSGLPTRVLSEKYGVVTWHICAVRRGDAWKHVGEEA